MSRKQSGYGVPITIDENTWMYAERKGLSVARQVVCDGTVQGTELFNIPWRLVRKAELQIVPESFTPTKPKRRKT